MQHKKIYYIFFIISTLITNSTIAIGPQFPQLPLIPFPLDKYDQNVEHWINPNDKDYDKPLLTNHDQKKRLEEFYNRYYATNSPWNEEHVIKYIAEANLKTIYSKEELFNKYGNSPIKDKTKIGYGINYLPYPDQWINLIFENINLNQFGSPIQYKPENRAIVVQNSHTRALPTNDPYYYSITLAGEGYPFDNLQESAVWVGTPVYIIGQTLDQQWYLVLTPDFIEWVQSNGVARVSDQFIVEWQEHAKQKMIAITGTNISIFDTKNVYRFNAYTGTVLPGTNDLDDPIDIKALIPIADTQHNAQIAFAKINNKNAAIMPLKATPHNFATVMSSLIGRPYGWGNINFYNDCSAELQSLYAPFGIHLDRNSASQEKAGRNIVDKSSATEQERLNYLMEHARKMTTIVYINGHVMSYIGSHPNPNSDAHELMAMTYQNMWGLRPADNSYREIIGKSVFFPLLQTYPENSNLTSLASKKCFKLIQLEDNNLIEDDIHENL